MDCGTALVTGINLRQLRRGHCGAPSVARRQQISACDERAGDAVRAVGVADRKPFGAYRLVVDAFVHRATDPIQSRAGDDD